jgi:hypothetical protein
MSPVFHRGGDKKRASERLHMVTSRLKIYVWAGSTEPEMIRGFGFLSDLSESGVGVYIGKQLPTASAVYVAFEKPDQVTYRGVIVWCNRFSFQQSFMGHDALSFRAGIKYLFGTEAERQRYLTYFSELKTRSTLVKPGMNF